MLPDCISDKKSESYLTCFTETIAIHGNFNVSILVNELQKSFQTQEAALQTRE
jgi:hypothetical protein